MLLDGTDIAGWQPERRARAGIARSWQAVELFDELTVRDNLLVAEETSRCGTTPLDLVAPPGQRCRPSANRVVDDLGLRDVLDQRPSTLPLGLVKLVGIARTSSRTPGSSSSTNRPPALDDEESRELAARSGASPPATTSPSSSSSTTWR